MSRPWIRGFLLSPVLVFLFGTTLHAQTDFVYTNDDVAGANTVSGFAVKKENGALTAVPGSPFLTGGTGMGGGLLGVNRATTCAATGRIYVSNAGSNDVSGFTVDPSTGSLVFLNRTSLSLSGPSQGGIALACTPDGRFLMAADSSSREITVLSIDGDNGSLKSIGGLTAGGTPEGIKISPDGRFLAVALVNMNAVAMFSIATDGTLAQVRDSPFSPPPDSAGSLVGVDINCASSLLFAGSSGASTTVNVFDIATEGALTPAVVPFMPGVGTNSSVVLLSPNEQLLFASNQLSNSVTVISFPAGSLSLVAGSPFAAPGSTFPSGMAVDQAGNFLYVADGSMGANASIHGYSVASTGVLLPVPGSPFRTNQPGRLLSLTTFPGKTCNQPPDCSKAIASPSTAWPPNHQMVSIGVSGVTDPDGDPVTITPTGVWQDEPVQPGNATLSPLAVSADRDGAGDGRVYTIQFTASDGRGGTCSGAVKVCVPHDQGSDPCVDQGPLNNSLQ